MLGLTKKKFAQKKLHVTELWPLKGHLVHFYYFKLKIATSSVVFYLKILNVYVFYVKKAVLLESVNKFQKKIHFKSQKTKICQFFVKNIDKKNPYISNPYLL